MKTPSPGIANAPIPTIQPNAPPGACARRRTLRSLSVLLVREILGSLLVGQQDRQIVIAETGSSQIVRDFDRLRLTLCETKYGFLCHVSSPYY